MSGDREGKYVALYFPEEMMEEKEKTYFALLDINCNFSKLIQVLLPQIKEIALAMFKRGENYLEYEWKLTVKLKRRKRGKR